MILYFLYRNRFFFFPQVHDLSSGEEFFKGETGTNTKRNYLSAWRALFFVKLWNIVIISPWRGSPCALLQDFCFRPTATAQLAYPQLFCANCWTLLEPEGLLPLPLPCLLWTVHYAYIISERRSPMGRHGLSYCVVALGII